MQNSQLGEKGLNISYTGNGKVKEQDKQEGEHVEQGTVINLKLEQIAFEGMIYKYGIY